MARQLHSSQLASLEMQISHGFGAWIQTERESISTFSDQKADVALFFQLASLGSASFSLRFPLSLERSHIRMSASLRKVTNVAADNAWGLESEKCMRMCWRRY